MKVMSFNVFCGGDGDRSWDRRSPLVIETIKKHFPDTFGLQEAHSMWMDCLCAALPEYDYVGVGRDDGAREGEFSPVFYKKDLYEVVEKGNFWLSETPDTPSRGWDAMCKRVCSYALLKNKATGETFAHFNTHLDHVGAVAQSEGAKMIAERANKFGSVPAVVTGDFNVTPDSGAYRTITSAGFEDARKLAPVTDEAGTFHDFGKTEEFIDYIFVKNGFRVVSYKTVTDRVDGKFPSDHYPVVAEIK